MSTRQDNREERRGKVLLLLILEGTLAYSPPCYNSEELFSASCRRYLYGSPDDHHPDRPRVCNTCCRSSKKRRAARDAPSRNHAPAPANTTPCKASNNRAGV